MCLVIVGLPAAALAACTTPRNCSTETLQGDNADPGARAYTCITYVDGGNRVRRKLTITVDEEVYEGLHRVVGRRRISRFLSELARPHVVRDDLEAGYQAMAADEERERAATEWIAGLIGDVADEPR